MTARLSHPVGDPILGRWRVVEVLGRGAFGTVYRCRDETGLEKAVKELHVFGDPERQRQALRFFRREAEHLTRLKHPAIPSAEAVDLEGPFHIDPATGAEVDERAKDWVTVPARHYLVMDYVAGRALESMVVEANQAGRALAAAQVLSWVLQLAGALEAIHQAGLVHRDVKPHNVLIRDLDQRAMLIDFGLCREAGEPGGYGTVPLSESGRVGTPGYAPPDPVEQENPVPASDVHALGMTARRALTGLDPTQPGELIILTQKRLVELLPDLPAHVGTALDRSVRPSTGDRFAAARDLVSALETPLGEPAMDLREPSIQVTPAELIVGEVEQGGLRDLSVEVRDERPGQRPRGEAVSNHDWLRILPPGARGEAVVLHLMLRVPRRAPLGPQVIELTVRANDEVHRVTIRMDVVPRRAGWLTAMRAGR